MGADWYNCFSFFGYQIEVPDDTTYRKLVRKIYGLNGILPEPFTIMGILSRFHSRMEGMDAYELSQMDKDACLIIGFYLTDNLTNMVELSVKLSDYVIDNPILEGLTLSKSGNLYSGIDWFSNIDEGDDDDDDDDDDEESDEESEDSEESDEESDEESEDESEESDEESEDELENS
jgi:hypothetical protein